MWFYDLMERWGWHFGCPLKMPKFFIWWRFKVNILITVTSGIALQLPEGRSKALRWTFATFSSVSVKMILQCFNNIELRALWDWYMTDSDPLCVFLLSYSIQETWRMLSLDYIKVCAFWGLHCMSVTVCTCPKIAALLSMFCRLFMWQR